METRNESVHLVNDVPSAFPVHPGDVLGEELKERGISQKEFAKRIGMQPSHLSALIHGMRNFTPAVAAKVESGLAGITADFWMRMQKSYNRDIRRKKRDTSNLVSGYGHIHTTPALVLNDPSVQYGEKCRISLSIPAEDKALLESLASRLGWTLEELG